MPRAAAAVDIGSVSDIDPGMGTPAAGWRLYSGRHDWFKFEYAGIPYFIPPDLDGILDDHPVLDEADRTPKQVVCDGILRLDDRVGRVYKTTPSGGPSSIPTNARRIYEAAREIVRFAVMNFGDRGITFLTDDERSNEARKAQARAAYMQAQVSHDQYLVQTYDEWVQKWKLRPQNANRPLPMPPEPIRLARERLDQRDASRQGLRKSFRFACATCGQYATDDQSKYDVHMAVNHGQGELSAREVRVIDPEVHTSNVAIAPKRRGRPPKNPQPAA